MNIGTYTQKMSKQSSFKQDWNAPGLYQDVLVAATEHLSKQDIFAIADKVKARGNWEFTSSGL